MYHDKSGNTIFRQKKMPAWKPDGQIVNQIILKYFSASLFRSRSRPWKVRWHIHNAVFIENGIKFKFSGFVRFYKGWKIAMFNDFKAQGLVRIHAYTVGWWQVGGIVTAPKRHYRTTSWWKRGSAELASPAAWGANSQPRLSMNPACITWFFVVISRKPYRRLYCSNSSILFWITLNLLYCTHCQQARRVIK